MQRVHFRRQTLEAYRAKCCICILAERPLLDAAHIIDDRLPEGVPTIRNGLSMCPTHHRAFDRGILLVREDYTAEVRRDRLTAATASATKQMLLDYAGRVIYLPRNEELCPDPALLRRKLELIA